MEVEGRSSSPKRGYISSTAPLLTSTTGCGSAESDCWAVADTATAQQSAPARPSASRFALGRYCSQGMQAPPPFQGKAADGGCGIGGGLPDLSDPTDFQGPPPPAQGSPRHPARARRGS